MRSFSLATTCLALAASLTAVSAQEPQSDWQLEKCRIYEGSWEEALEFFGSDNINYAFLAENENFIASGCTDNSYVCPQSSQEFEIANALTIAMMNAGTASTFLPFRCKTNG